MEKNRFATGLWNIIYPLLLYFVGRYLILSVAVVGCQSLGNGEISPFLYGVINAAAMLGGLAFLFPTIKLEREETREKKVPFFAFLILTACSISAVILMNILMEKSGLVQQSELFQETSRNQFGVPLWLGLLLYGLIAPLAEEFLFRFVLLGRIRKWTGRALTAVIVSSTLFGIYHGNMVQGIYAFVLGCVLACITLYYENIWTAVFFHSIGNIVIFLCGMYPWLGDIFFSKVPVYAYIFVLILCLGLQKKVKLYLT